MLPPVTSLLTTQPDPRQETLHIVLFHVLARIRRPADVFTFGRANHSQRSNET